MERLREGTRVLHDSAEGHAFQQAFFAGKLPSAAYAAYLGQMVWVYRELETHLRGLLTRFPEWQDVVRPHCFREHDLRRDLDHLGVSADSVRPLAATQAICARIARDAAARPLALLGMHYVLEGSNNGNRFIARNIRKAYDLPENEGTAFLDPYGESQRPKWQDYKEAMGRLPLSAAEQEVMMEAAQEMFRAIAHISTELSAAART